MVTCIFAASGGLLAIEGVISIVRIGRHLPAHSSFTIVEILGEDLLHDFARQYRVLTATTASLGLIEACQYRLPACCSQ